MQLQARLAYRLLQRHFSLPLQIPHISEESMELIYQLIQNTEAGPDTNYSRLTSLGSLMDFVLMIHARAGKGDVVKGFRKLKQALEALNARIKEVQGFNLMMTRAKDVLIILAAKLDHTSRMIKKSGA